MPVKGISSLSDEKAALQVFAFFLSGGGVVELAGNSLYFGQVIKEGVVQSYQ